MGPDANPPRTRLAWRSAYAIAGVAVGSALQFVFVVVLSRGLGRSGAGVFLEAFAAVNVLTVVAMMGLDVTAIRYVAVHIAEGRYGLAASLARRATVVATAVSTATALMVIAIAPTIAHYYDASHLTTELRILALSLPFIVAETVMIGVTRGTSRMGAYVLVDQIFTGVARLAGVGAALLLGFGVFGAAWGFVAASIVVAAAAAYSSRAVLFARERGLVNLHEVSQFAGYQWMASVASMGLLWADTLLLGLWRPPAQVAVYTVAVRAVLLGTVFVLPIGVSFQPLIARAWARGDRQELHDLYVLATRWTTVAGCPPLIFVAAFATPILAILYGPAYTGGAVALTFLAGGQLANALSGPCGHVVTMAGRADLVVQNTVAALVVNIVLNIILIPPFGGAGAGAAWGVSMIVWNGWRLAQVWVILRMHPFGRWVARVLPVLLAFAGTVVAAKYAVGAQHAPITRVAVGAAASGAVLLAGLASIGQLGDAVSLVTRWGRPS